METKETQSNTGEMVENKQNEKRLSECGVMRSGDMVLLR